MLLADKVALITGGASGIGKAAARLMAREGCRVALVDIDRPGVAQAEEEIVREGGDALAIPGDIALPQDMAAAVAAILDRWGHLEIVFANAGINGVWAPLESITPEEWDATLATNLRGTFLTVKHAVPALKAHGGSVIITSSVNGTRMFSNSGATAYACSKAAQAVFAKMTALELARHRIRVNVICPGAIYTNIGRNTVTRDLGSVRPSVHFPEGVVPLTGGKPGFPDQVAQLVLFLASDAASLISGTEIWIDGAESLLQG